MNKLASIILIFVLLIATAMVVNAHPGRTDGNGGHTDHSTGEYHYHHGYSAHDHYDMDGDGDLDCPYDFADRTGINSGSNYSSNNDNVILKTETITKTVIEEVPYIPSWIYWVIGILVAICLIMLVNIRWKKEEIQGWEKQYRKIKDDYEKAIEEHERSISEVKKTCSHKIEQNTLFYENKTRSLMQSINSLQIENATLKENDRKSKIEENTMYQNIIALVKDYLDAGEKASTTDLIDLSYYANKIYDYCTNREESYLILLIMQKIDADLRAKSKDG